MPARVQRGLPLNVTLSASDVNSGGALIQSAQAYVDTPPWAGGTPIALQATDGRYDETVETIRGSLSTASLAPGRHILYLRARDSAVHTDPALTHWGPIYAHFFIVTGDRGLYVPTVLAE